ncbi:papilin-like isoform X2, partial [Paramuricea clavata]
MKTLNLCYHFTFFIITCCGCCCSKLITTSRAVNINTTDEIHIEVIFNNKTVLTHERIELVCEVKPEVAVLATVWMKENETISENRRVKIREDKLIINRTMESDAGYYTCSVTTPFGIQNKTAFLTVTKTEEEDDESQEEGEDGDYSGGGEDLPPCGMPRKKLSE